MGWEHSIDRLKNEEHCRRMLFQMHDLLCPSHWHILPVKVHANA
jgi:hypothetical protein